ncbi:reverse transcriptase domain-containing protein [Maribacter ulvicola]|nr:reverse transcriptase domain-containing protein [Maribacter ulvicola]
MKTTKEDIALIREKFNSLSTKEDLVNLLNVANVLLYGEDAFTLKESTLAYYANPAFCTERYTSFEINKKSGGTRTINAPVKGLKSILKTLNFVLQCISEPHHKATGFVINKSVVTNAKFHVGNHYVYNIDLKDFFHSFDRNRVKLGFMQKPFNLNKDREPIAFLLSCLCTHPFKVDDNLKIVLPQGAPTSPTISNILCSTLDRRLNGLAKKFKINYSRYADDITFSSQVSVFKRKDFQKELLRIITEDQGLVLNEKKTRLQQSGYRQEVTGLIVNEKVNVSRRYIKNLRMWLYYWEKYGFKRAEIIFKKNYILDRGHIKKSEPNFINVITGKLEYLKMVKGPFDSTFIKLNSRFELLLQNESMLEQILKVWENQGIEKAMELYNK